MKQQFILVEKLKNHLFRFFCILFLFIHITNCDNSEDSSKSADVAIYSDNGTWDESVKASENMFKWMGYTVAKVDANDINTLETDNFSILCIPGGDMYEYAQDISQKGKNKIRDFLIDGGGYIGICGGAYFASEKVIWKGDQLSMTPLGIFKGTASGPNDEIVPYPDFDVCRMNIVDHNHSITLSEPDSVWMLYYWGPILVPNNDTEVTVLGRYNSGNQPSMIALNYGLGRVFLIGTHPEIEEDNNRDGVTFADELDDQGSDWDLMKKAVVWCLNDS